MIVVSLMRLDDQESRLKEAYPDVSFHFYKHPSELPHDIQKKWMY
ncbi:phosphoglycerate dehydrogenase [Staphylococcus aureus]|nr:phosphoglycerate dehydrogenase [Staphylococcus aureus]